MYVLVERSRTTTSLALPTVKMSAEKIGARGHVCLRTKKFVRVATERRDERTFVFTKAEMSHLN